MNILQRLAAVILPTPTALGAPPTTRPSAVNLGSEPLNVSRNATAQTVQQAISSAETGYTRDLFCFYRDTLLGHSHIQAEFSKRIMAVLSAQPSILPVDKENVDDVAAAALIQQAIDDCENFTLGCSHLLSGFFYPVSVVAKVFRPASELLAERTPAVPLTWTLRCLDPVNPALLCFQQSHQATVQAEWEPEMRLHTVAADGSVSWSVAEAQPLRPMEHIVHRGHVLSMAKDTFGGPARAVLGWYLLSILGRDWFGRAMERYGAPFPVAKTNTENTAAVAFLRSALSLSTKLGGLVVDESTEVELLDCAKGDMAGAYEKFIGLCHREISKLIVGQTSSSEAQSVGLNGGGIAKAQREVREDLERFDRMCLAATLKEQLFKPLLRLNGAKGRVPNIVWGGLDADAAQSLGALLASMKNGGLQPADEALPGISERVGFKVERMAAPAPGAFPGGNPLGLNALSAVLPDWTAPASDRVAREKAAALAAAFRGELAPVPVILRASASPEEFFTNLQRFFAGWKPAKTVAVAEEALQLCAAAGGSKLPQAKGP